MTTKLGSVSDKQKQTKQTEEFGRKADFERLKQELCRSLPYLAKHQLVEIRKLMTGQFRKRFSKSRPSKYGSLDKGFTEQETSNYT